MDWIIRLQKAIEYIEAYLADDQGELQLDLIAREAYSSEFNFQKVFSIITGITVGEYIRNRRLMLAGEELIMSDAKILDVALKYGYESAGSFTKAFARFHGATPSAVRNNHAELKSYNRLIVTIKVEGGTSLDYRLTKHDRIRVLAKSKVFKASSLEENQRAIPEFLERCAKEGLYEFLSSNIDASTYFADAVLGVHDSVDCMADGSEFRVSTGVEFRGDVARRGYTIVDIPAGTWLVFRCTGLRPMAIQKLWYRIYTEFLPFTSYRIREMEILEVCLEGFRNAEDVVSELWFPLANE